MTDSSWDLSDLSTGAQIFDAAGRALTTLAQALQPPNPAMYGSFVSNAEGVVPPFAR